MSRDNYTPLLSLPRYYAPQKQHVDRIEPQKPHIVQVHLTRFTTVFSDHPALQVMTQLPWTMESLPGSQWANIYTGEQRCIRHVACGKNNRCYPITDTDYSPEISTIGYYDATQTHFLILKFVRIDGISPQAMLPWYRLLQDFLSACYRDLEQADQQQKIILHMLTLQHQYAQVQRVINACHACIHA